LPAAFCTTLHPTAGLLLKLCKIGPGWSLDGRPNAAGSGVGELEEGILFCGQKKIKNKKKISQSPRALIWGHCHVHGAVFQMGVS
jgi:hypothetical protein